MEALKIILAGVCAYLIGSISSAVLVSYVLSHKDIRNYGSGNAGATNMARFFGMGAGVLVFALDFLKTVAAMALGRLIGGEYGFLLSAVGCITGHCFPVFFKFKGGKGVTVGAAIGLMFNWKVFVLIVAAFFVVFFLTRRVSAGSVTSALAFVPAQLLSGIRDPWALATGAFVGLTVLFMHRQNIRRLLTGQEKPFKANKMRRKRKDE